MLGCRQIKQGLPVSQNNSSVGCLDIVQWGIRSSFRLTMSLQLFGSWEQLLQQVIVLPCIACAFPIGTVADATLLVLLKHLVTVMQLMKTLSWFWCPYIPFSLHLECLERRTCQQSIKSAKRRCFSSQPLTINAQLFDGLLFMGLVLELSRSQSSPVSTGRYRA